MLPEREGAFTLIELLVVIAIIAVLSVVVVLSLNPAELLRQSRDANRLSDLSTLNSALALYTTDQAGVSGFSLGNASSVYVSLPDSSSTCGTWNLPTLPTGYTYNCVTATSSKNINNSGWIPVNFSNISGGAPFSNLPIDNVNQSSTGLYYVYYSNGSQYEVTAIPESQKQKAALGTKSIIQNYPGVLANGSSLSVSPLFSANGLVGYWPMDEGSGAVAYDQSGNNTNGGWSGTQAGSGGTYYVSGKVGAYAGYFNGSNDYLSIATTSLQPSTVTLAMWVYENSLWATGYALDGIGSTGSYGYDMILDHGYVDWNVNAASRSSIGYSPISAGMWYFLVGTFDGANMHFFVNGKEVTGSPAAASLSYSTFGAFIGYPTSAVLPYTIDDFRIYNRALSLAEIQALYNAGK